MTSHRSPFITARTAPSSRAFKAALLLAATLGMALPAHAASIYGSLKQAGKPVTGASIKLLCGGTISAGQSDARGNYSLSIAKGGSCTLTVDSKSTSVQLGEEPKRQDFEVPAGDAPLRPL